MNIFTNTIGWIAFTGILIAFLPQALKTIKTKSVKGISWKTFAIQFVGNYLCVWGGLFLNNMPVGFLNVIVLYFAATILHYILIDKGYDKQKVLTFTITSFVINTITGILFLVNYVMTNNGHHIIPNIGDKSINPWFVTIFTASAGIAIAAAFVPQVIETWKTKITKNISIHTSIIYSIGNISYILYFILNISLVPNTWPAWTPSLLSVTITAILQIFLIVWKLQWEKSKSKKIV